jgi:hypothetical protein
MAKKHGKSPQQRAAETRRQRREQDALRNAYNQKFGIPMVFEWSAKNIKLLKRALATGKDQPELIAMRKECERNLRAYDKRRAKEEAAKLVYVFTADDEKEYTGYIKKRKLWEGACDLNWPKYRAYRAAHPESAPLDAKDLRYVGQWTGVFKPKL